MPLLLVLIWLVLEVMLSARLADVVGSGGLLLWMVASILLGAGIIRGSGWQATVRIREALSRNELPARDMLDAMLWFAAGMLLILPGPISDGLGLLLLLPPLRRRALRAADAGVRRARPHLHDPVIIEGEFEDVEPDRIDRQAANEESPASPPAGEDDEPGEPRSK